MGVILRGTGRVTDYPIPDVVFKSHVAVLGKTGSGKTWAMKGAGERLMDQGARLCIIDPTGAWHGIRSSVSGKRAGYPVVIFGGLHADLPLGGAHGEAIAEVIGTSSTPSILDTSLMKVSERTRFFADFGDAIMRKNKGALHLVIDEAHLFMPQGKVSSPQAGEMLAAGNNMVSGGRSRGLRIIMVTQRPAKLHKDSLTQAETLIAMRLIAPQDRAAVKDWIKDNADEAKAGEIISSLATLKTGEGWIWSPELKLLERVKFPPIKTFDSGRAPDGTEAAATVLAPIDRDAIAKKLEVVASDAIANDPKRLKARIAELEREARKPVVAAVDEAAKEKSFNAGYDSGRAAGWNAARSHISMFGRELTTWAAGLPQLPAMNKIDEEARPLPKNLVHRRESHMPKPAATPIINPDVTPTGQKILDALAELGQMGASQPSRELLAFMSGYTHVNSKGFSNGIGSLRSGGLIEGTALTEAGRAAANPPDAPRTPKEMQDRIIAMLGGASARVLRPLIDAYPNPVERQALAEAAGYGHVNSKGFSNAIGRFRTLGFIDYPDRGHVVAKPLLFLEG